MQTINLRSGSATLLISAGDGPSLIVNTDANNTLWLGDTSGAAPGNLNEVAPLGPGASIGVNGDKDVYGVADPSVGTGTIQILVIDGGLLYFLGLTQGFGKLAVASIQSPNYIPGVQGWSINKNGTAEFNGVVVRGNLDFPNGYISNGDGTLSNTAGLILYNGTPAKNGLLFTACGAAGQDQFGNLILANPTVYSKPAGIYNAVNFTGGGLTLYISPGDQTTVWLQNPESLQLASTLVTLASSGTLNFESTTQTQFQIGVPGSGTTIAVVNTSGLLINTAIQFKEQSSAPPAIVNQTQIYADSLGFLQSLVSNDGNTYNIGQAVHDTLLTSTINSVAFTAVTGIFNVIANKRYEYHALVHYHGNQAGGNPVFGFNHPAGSYGFVQAHEEWSQSGSAPSLTNSDASFLDVPGPTLNTGRFCYESKGWFVPSANQTFGLSAACTVAADTWVIESALIRLIPLS